MKRFFLIILILAANVVLRLSHVWWPAVPAGARPLIGDMRVFTAQKHAAVSPDYWKDDAGQMFLLEGDPYHWYRLTANLLATGRVSDTIINGIAVDSYMAAPAGKEARVSLHKNLPVYLSAFLFRVWSSFNRGLTLMRFVFYLPVAVAAAALAVFFFFARGRNKEGATAALYATAALGTAPIFLARSMGGWFDTDPYIILFSTLSVWAVYENMRRDQPFRLFFAGLGGLCTGFFALTWDGWWYVFDMVMICCIFFGTFRAVSSRTPEKWQSCVRVFKTAGMFFLTSMVFVYLFTGAEASFDWLLAPARMLRAKNSLIDGIWPNAFQTIDELRGSSLIEIWSQAGWGIVPLIGIAYLFTGWRPKHTQDKFLKWLFTLWIVAITAASFRAIRFSLLLTIPVSLCFGMAVQSLFDFTRRRQYASPVSVSIKALVIILFAVMYAKSLTVRSIKPFINRTWYHEMNAIQERTPPDAIINAWWDYGHMYKALAQRRVIIDGATVNTPVAYWMARALTAADENEAVGILRMLNSGSNSAFDALEALAIPKEERVRILLDLVKLDEAGALEYLKPYGKDFFLRMAVVRLTHHPAPAYIVVDDGLAGAFNTIVDFAGRGYAGDTLFDRLYYKNGEGTRHFKLLTEDRFRDRDGKVLVYEIVW